MRSETALQLNVVNCRMRSKEAAVPTWGLWQSCHVIKSTIPLHKRQPPDCACGEGKKAAYAITLTARNHFGHFNVIQKLVCFRIVWSSTRCKWLFNISEENQMQQQSLLLSSVGLQLLTNSRENWRFITQDTERQPLRLLNICFSFVHWIVLSDRAFYIK